MDQNDTPKDSTETEKEYTAYVSPRLRSKMSDRYEDEKESGPGATIAVVGLLAVIVICGGLFLLGNRAKKAEPGQTAEASQTPEHGAAGMPDSAAIADSLSALAAADSLARLASTPTTPVPATPTPTTKPVPKPGATPLASNTGTPTNPAPAASPARYGIVVGSYLFDDKAGTEKDRLAAATSLEGKVVEKVESGTSTYQVVLGSFASRAEAEAKGAELLGAGTVRESRVVPLRK